MIRTCILAFSLKTAGVAIVVSPVAAATTTLLEIDGISCAFSTSGGVEQCSDTKDLSGNLATYSLTGRANPGDLGIFASVLVTDNRAGTNGGASPQANGTVGFSDTLTFGVQEGTLVLPVDIGGTLNAPAPGADGFGGGGTNRVNVQAQYTYGSTGGTIYQEIRDGSSSPLRDNEVISKEGNQGVTTLELPFSSGTLDLSFDLSADVFCNVRIEGNDSCLASADFLGSLTFLGASVLDGTGTAVMDPAISSASGFDYLAGANTAVVPLPAPLALLLTGLSGLWLIGRRSAAQSVFQPD